MWWLDSAIIWLLCHHHEDLGSLPSWWSMVQRLTVKRHRNTAINSIKQWALYHAPVIPAGIRQNPVESFLAESPAKIAILGTIYSSRIEPFRNWDWSGPGMDWNGIWWNARKKKIKLVNIAQFTIWFGPYNNIFYVPTMMFSSNKGVLRALKMKWQWVSLGLQKK